MPRLEPASTLANTNFAGHPLPIFNGKATFGFENANFKQYNLLSVDIQPCQEMLSALAKLST